MFPSNWFETGLALLIIFAIGMLMKHRQKSVDTITSDDNDYVCPGTDPGPAENQTLPKGFGTAENHPHRKS